MTCPNCGNALPADAAFCTNCGHRMAPAPQPTPSNTQAPPSDILGQTAAKAFDRAANFSRSPSFTDFVRFRRMITPQLIQTIYVIVAVLITLGGLVSMFRDSDGFSGSFLPGGFLGGLLVMVVGNLGWRLWCEFIIVIFRINSTLTNIDDNTRR